MKRYKLIIADDEYIVRKGIAKMIAWETLPVELVAECSNGLEVAKTVRQLQGDVDILLTDALMPEMDGIALAGWMHAHCPKCDVIFFSGHSEYKLLREAMQNHAVDYLLKPVERTSLNRTLEAVIQKKSQRQTPEEALYVKTKMLLNYAHSRIPFDECMNIVSLPAVILLMDCGDNALPSVTERFHHLFQNGFITDDAASPSPLLFAIAMEPLTDVLKKAQTMQTLVIHIGISQTLKDLRQLPFAYLQAKKALLDCYSLEECVQVCADDYQSNVVVSVMEYIEHNYQSAITLQSASDTLCYNASYISRTFKAQIGQTFTQYLTTKRIEKAKELLAQHKEYRITQLAEAVGIPDVNYFCKVFKKESKQTPQQYKKALKRGRDAE